jgi:MtN3 and saliva related transmembrane protein
VSADWASWVGYAAAALTTAAFVPQAWLTLRTRDVRGISLGMYVCFTAGVALWLAYGVALGQWPIIVANAITLALAACILAVKIDVERARRRTGRGAGGDGQNGLSCSRSPASDASRD